MKPSNPLWRGVLLFFVCALLGINVGAQARNETSRETATHSPQPANCQLVEENEFYRTCRAEIFPGGTLRAQQSGHDAVVVALGEGLTLDTGKGAATLTNEEARFVPQRSFSEITNAGSGLPQVVVVLLKRHWDPEMKVCADPSPCARPIKMGENTIGETTALFGNGFITAQRHRIEAGGTLDSSYFSSKGKDHLLLIALSDLEANFGGTAETLQRGQSYSSDASEIEVTAPKTEAKWIVIRLQIPKIPQPN